MFAWLDALSTQERLTLLRIEAAGSISCVELNDRVMEPRERLAARLHRLSRNEWIVVEDGTVTLTDWADEIVTGLRRAIEAYGNSDAGLNQEFDEP